MAKKRSWRDSIVLADAEPQEWHDRPAQSVSGSSGTGTVALSPLARSVSPLPSVIPKTAAPLPPSTAHVSPPPSNPDDELISVTTRKSKACPACRKQKIKCIMDNEGPPCKRCSERGLLCSPNKTLQNLVQDQALWNARAMQHIARLETALNETRAIISLSAIQVPINEIEPSEQDVKLPPPASDEDLDGSMTIPTPESVASAPIRSLYEVTRSKAFREGDDPDLHSTGVVLYPDFVTKGVIRLADAERLTKDYISRIDHYFYGHLEKFGDFTAIRRTSTFLALMVCTVAAIHDPHGSDMYEKLTRELRVMMINVMFRPSLADDDIRALCIGAYWLSDMTWMLTGLAIRKAISMQYHKAHLDQPTENREIFEHSRLWLLTYLCNEQVSILQGVPPSGVTRDYVRWQQHMTSSFATDADVRCVSHIDLLLILSRARELYGLDTTKPIPAMLVPQLREFIIQVDRWGTTWSGKLARNHALGNFPCEAVQVQYHFAKFYLCSHAFRGLHSNEDTGVDLSHDLEDIATCAIATAFSILHALLGSEELRVGLVGVPHFFHTMYAFAAVFLLKVSTRYTQHVTIDQQLVFQTITQVVDVFSNSPCARQHLVHRITRGLKEMLERCRAQAAPTLPTATESVAKVDDSHQELLMNPMLEPLDLENFDFLSSMPPSWPTDFNTM